jgi:hypothetical protein
MAILADALVIYDERNEKYHDNWKRMGWRGTLVRPWRPRRQGTKYGARHHHGLVIQRTRATGNLKPMRFVSLHHHSTFSYLDGYQLPEAHVRRATEINMGAIAMTEHGNIDSHVKFEKAAEKAGVKPIFGCEVYMPTTSVTRTAGPLVGPEPRRSASTT